jgi:G patch domain-containing protein 1
MALSPVGLVQGKKSSQSTRDFNGLTIFYRYFNTVGSKEGWTPSTFVSSRTNRKKDEPKPAQQRPEDFMDEEDIADAEDARRVQTAEGFAGFGLTEDDAVRRGGLIDLFRIEGETIGVKLLKKMGWKEGQGVGPKVRRKARLDGVERSGDDTDATHLFAPENTQMISFIRKNDHKGLGFDGETKLSSSLGGGSDTVKSDDEDDDRGLLAPKISKKKKPKSGGIGIGILNDTGSDDEDPYEIGPRISYNKVIGGDKKKKKSINGAANPLLKSKPVFISKVAKAKASAGLRKCLDGRLPLDGFILSSSDEFSSVIQSAGQYVPPKIPEGWISSKQPKPGYQNAAYLSTAEAAKASKLDPKTRASILGEAALPGKSVFDFLSPAARDRLAAASGKSNLPAALGEIPEGYSMTEEERQRDLLAQIPKVDKYTADAALSRGASGFMPYGEDEAKRARYRTFLEYQAGLYPIPPEKPSSVSREDWLKELREFANCAQIFKPMSGMMATRFTSSTTAPKLTSDAPDTLAPESLLSKPAPKPEDPAEQAARLGMYGPMTRSSQGWYPTRLLCKRFNVKPPAHVQPGATEHGEEGPRNNAPDLISKTAIDDLIRETGGFNSNWNERPRESIPAEPASVSVEKKEEVVVDAERNEALEGQRAGEAVFKAIFGDDSDDEE